MYEEVKQTVDVTKVHIFIVGNKNDLYEQEKIPKAEAEQYAKSINANYRCVSALQSNGGVNELFETLGKNLITNKFCEPKKEEENKNNSVVLSREKVSKEDKQKKKGKCKRTTKNHSCTRPVVNSRKNFSFSTSSSS